MKQLNFSECSIVSGGMNNKDGMIFSALAYCAFGAVSTIGATILGAAIGTRGPSKLYVPALASVGFVIGYLTPPGILGIANKAYEYGLISQVPCEKG